MLGLKKVCLLNQQNEPWDHAFRDHVRIVRGDATAYMPTEVFDLVVIDAFYEELDTVMSTVLGNILGRCLRFVVNLGSVDEIFWIEKIVRIIEGYADIEERLGNEHTMVLLCKTK